MSISKAVIMGTVVRNPEKRYTTNNIPITYFTINFGKADVTNLLRVVTKGKLAETAAETVKKDSVVVIEGRLQTNVIKDDNAEKKVVELDAMTVEVINTSTGSETQNQGAVEDLDFGNNDINPDDLIGEDEIPF